MGSDDGLPVPDAAQPDAGSSDVVRLLAEFDQQVSHLSFAAATRAALSFVSERLGLARVSVALLEVDGTSFRIFESTAELRGIESGQVVPFHAGSMGRTVERQTPTYRPSIPEGPTENVVDAALLAAGYRSGISIPLLCGGRCIGTLNAAARAVDGISQDTRRRMTLLAPRLAFAIHVGLAHQQLAESEARFRDVFATVGDGIVVADVSNRRIVMVNPAMCAMLGRAAETLLGLPIDTLHPADCLEQIIASFAAVIEKHHDQALDIPVVRADGTVLLTDVAARPTTLSGKPCLVGVFRDATSRRQREQEQVQIQKLDSIRTLAAGIAHDFNNLLTGLIGYMSLVQPHLAPDSEPWQMLDEARRAAVRATGLTRQLLTFAKGGSPMRKITDLVPVVRESARLSVSGSNVKCELEVPQRRVLVLGDEGQLAQVTQNLVRNAVEAMPSGGIVHIRISLGLSSTVGKGEEACIEVSDAGTGIDPALLDRVFVPFFSTKPSGSGLGLAAAYSIVHSHGGRITVTSRLHQGTTFTVFLPVADVADEVTPPAVLIPAASGRVLVMDDQAVIRHVVEKALREVGCDTCLTSNGEEAIAAYREALIGGRPFGAAILDMTIPGGMGGREVAAAILALDPAAKLIVSSGYSENAVMSDHRSHGFRAVLPKPYSAEQLRAVVARVLQAPSG